MACFLSVIEVLERRVLDLVIHSSPPLSIVINTFIVGNPTLDLFTCLTVVNFLLQSSLCFLSSAHRNRIKSPSMDPTKAQTTAAFAHLKAQKSNKVGRKAGATSDWDMPAVLRSDL